MTNCPFPPKQEWHYIMGEAIEVKHDSVYTNEPDIWRMWIVERTVNKAYFISKTTSIW